MAARTVVVVTHVYDQVDLLPHFFAWYSELGVDAFLVQDMGSTDGTLELLDELAKVYPIDWFSLEQKDLRQHRGGNTGDEMALLARAKLNPTWLMMCDADEFLILEHDTLRVALDKAQGRGLTSINIPCFNMTGRSLPRSGDAVASLSLRVVEPYVETADEQVSGALPQPYVFIRHMHKSIVLAAAFAGYRPGSHGATVSFGNTGEIEGAHFNHYLIRGWDKFEQKISNVETFLAVNSHLPAWWGWHWRRWIKLAQSGQLRAEYDSQFVSAEREAELLESGICVVERRIADWAERAGNDPGRAGPVARPAEVVRADGAVTFHDWFICDHALETPEWIDWSDWLAFSPFLFWLVDVSKPRNVLDIGAIDESSCFTFGQALELGSQEGRCVTVRPGLDDRIRSSQDGVAGMQWEHMMSRYRHRLTVLESIELALRDVADRSLDLVSIHGSRLGEFDAALIERLLLAMSDRGVVVAYGRPPTRDGGSIATLLEPLSQARPRFELYHAGGMLILGLGSAVPAPLRRLFALSSEDASRFCTLYARLGAALPRPNRKRAHEPLPAIELFGPKSIRPGEPFNVQDDGQSAVWVKTAAPVPPHTRLMWDGTPLVTLATDRIVTAAVPAHLTAKPGLLTIWLEADGIDGTRMSERVKIEVARPSKPTRAGEALPSIEGFGPQPVEHGKPFNVQADGRSAMWLQMAGALPDGASLVFGDTALPTVVRDKVVTAIVPSDLIAKPGIIMLRLEAEENGTIRTSNSVQFEVV